MQISSLNSLLSHTGAIGIGFAIGACVKRESVVLAVCAVALAMLTLYSVWIYRQLHDLQQALAQRKAVLDILLSQPLPTTAALPQSTE